MNEKINPAIRNSNCNKMCEVKLFSRDEREFDERNTER